VHSGTPQSTHSLSDKAPELSKTESIDNQAAVTILVELDPQDQMRRSVNSRDTVQQSLKVSQVTNQK
jgi:hypothetical protein